MANEETTEGEAEAGDLETRILALLEQAIPKVVTPLIEASQAKLAGNVNRELAGFRKRIERSGGETPQDGESKSKPTEPKPQPAEDVNAQWREVMRIGELKAKLPAEVLAAVDAELGEGASLAETAKAYKLAAAMAPKPSTESETKRGGGETPVINRNGSRTASAANRSVVARPGSRDAWAALKIEDKRKVFDAHPDFDPDTLSS